MTDEELKAWWPDFGTVVAELRRADQPNAAELLLDAVRRAAMSSEVLGNVGAVLRSHRALRSKLSRPGKQSWDAVMTDVNRHNPVQRLVEWLMQHIQR